ncbi:hypothetical protein [uncultured Phascolarctobacterium sp.]|uniref:hypothetical protein n=1 Tax=uncultured Phascolarctobacterium sp. TaxID=512296 RepID=UPI0025D50DF8|nr:hypothetical protein [uncultured Phascolarctobacterium sp.]
MIEKLRQKTKFILLAFCVALAVFNYDRIVVRLLSFAPASVENHWAEQYMPDKFWLHRVDSVAKQQEFAGKYAGLEFDIIYYEDSRAFENSHDKDDLKAYNLEKQFQKYASLPTKNNLWLDFKNLSLDNKDDALTVLNSLMDKYGVDKSKVYVESKCYQALDAFKQAGFKTSYYFPYYKFKKMSKTEINDVKIKTEAIAASGNIDAISFQGDYYEFVSGLQLPPNIVLLSWLDGQSWYEVLLRRKYAAIRDDDRVKVILVREHGKYHR